MNKDEAKPAWNGRSLDTDAKGVLDRELEDALAKILEAWFPRCVDQEHGGFLSDFDYRWRPRGRQLKMLEYQTRMLRLISRAAAYPRFESYRQYATHGFQY